MEFFQIFFLLKCNHVFGAFSIVHTCTLEELPHLTLRWKENESQTWQLLCRHQITAHIHTVHTCIYVFILYMHT